MELFDPNMAFLWRSIERFTNILIGALSIYLGYKLFMNLPEQRGENKGEAKLLLPGDISVYVSRVGPGVFFAMFGTAMVLMSFISPLTINPTNNPTISTAQVPSPAVNKAAISYVSGGPEINRMSTDRVGVQRDIVALNSLELELSNFVETNTGPTISTAEANTLLNTLQRVKRALLLDVWDKQWGDTQEFSHWVQEGAIAPAPPGMALVEQIFTGTPKDQP